MKRPRVPRGLAAARERGRGRRAVRDGAGRPRHGRPHPHDVPRAPSDGDHDRLRRGVDRVDLDAFAEREARHAGRGDGRVLDEFRAHGFDLIVNATPVGKENDEFPFVIDTLANGTLVVDLAYGARPTPLVSAVLARGGKAVDGYDVLLTQVRKQFQIMTGLEMPAVISRETVLPTSATSFVSPETVLATGAATEACEYSF